jgi:hypothetical protein
LSLSAPPSRARLLDSVPPDVKRLGGQAAEGGGDRLAGGAEAPFGRKPLAEGRRGSRNPGHARKGARGPRSKLWCAEMTEIDFIHESVIPIRFLLRRFFPCICRIVWKLYTKTGRTQIGRPGNFRPGRGARRGFLPRKRLSPRLFAVFLFERGIREPKACSMIKAALKITGGRI